jgi:hypothetical protein
LFSLVVSREVMVMSGNFVKTILTDTITCQRQKAQAGDI